jgi:DNA-binding SARP family transcriptional activator
VPWALTHFVGWPLPHAIPSWSRLSSDLNQHGIPDTVLLKALACVVWVSWAILVVSAAVEIPAVLRGRTARRLPLAGSFQPLVGHLVAAILVAALAVMPRAAPGGPARLAATIPYVRPSQSAIVMALAADTAPVSDPTPAAAATLPVTRAATTYVVQRGDTLWGIAERLLGDPLRWREIFALNEGRIEPGGQAFTDPNWIYPGWDLELPTATTTAPAPAAPAPVLPAAPTVPGPSPSTPAVPTPTTGPTSTSTVPTTTPHLGAPAPNGHVPHHAPDGAQPVQLPSGSVVAGSFAAGVLSAMAIGRLRRRHGYHFRPPRPGRDLGADPPRPTLRHLLDATAAHDDSTNPAEMDESDVLPTGPFDDTERRQHPGTLEIGTRDGAPVTVELTEVSGVSLCGTGRDEIARALVCGLLVRAGPGAAQVLLTTDLGQQLLPGLADPAIRHANNEAEAARSVEAERIARIRRLSSVDASDANQFRLDNPENPLPLLLVVLDAPPDASLGRWTALLGDCARLGIVVVFLTDSPAATARLAVNPVRTVVDAPEHLIDRVVGAQLYGMRADEAVELLGSTTLLRHESSDAEASELTPSDEPWPQTTPADGPDRGDRALRVEVLGPQRITAFGETVTRGLRNRAKTLLAWYLLRPEGATSEQAVDALWPDTPPERVLKQFWYALGDLRSFFRGPEDESLDVLEKIGDHYRPSPAEISCDLWEFQSALAEAARTDNNYDHVRAALRRAVDAYRGDLLAGTDHLWIEPARQDLHRRAVDAHLRLAELEDHAGQPDAAVEVLERVVELDRYAEEPYRRLMTLQAGLSRLDAVSATWQMLHRRLAELDLEVDEATVRLYRSLVDDSSPRAAVQQIRLSS